MTYIPQTSVEAGMLAAKQEDIKLKRYKNLASSHIVMPVGVETLGSWGSMGLSFIKDLHHAFNRNIELSRGFISCKVPYVF